MKKTPKYQPGYLHQEQTEDDFLVGINQNISVDSWEDEEE